MRPETSREQFSHFGILASNKGVKRGAIRSEAFRIPFQNRHILGILP